jgi:hypothetical protein
MHEGKKLEELLGRHNHTFQEFADACEVSKSRVSHYVRMERFEPVAWERVCLGLRALKIDRREIRPAESTAAEGAGRSPSRDLRSCLTGLTQEQLRNVLTILRADPESRERIAWVIEDRLERG